MNFQNYSGLRTVVSKYLDNTDANPVIPTFIALAESDMDRSLRVMDMQEVSNDVGVSGKTRYVLPSDWLEMISVKINGRPVDYRTPQHMQSGRGFFYTISGGFLEFSSPVSEGADIEITYFKRIPRLSDTVVSNFVLSKYPAIYLYGALVHGGVFILDDDRISAWQTLFDKAVFEANSQSAWARYAGGKLSFQYGAN